MKEKEEYWLNLYRKGKIKVDLEKGLVYSLMSGKEHIYNSISKDNYIRGTIYCKEQNKALHMLIHRFIWIVANGEIPDKIEVNHKNGIKYDNRLENLELTDKSENALHSRRILGNKGGCVVGEECALSKLKESDVLEIRTLYSGGDISYKKISEIYNVDKQTIRDIALGLTWKHVGGTISQLKGNRDIRIKLNVEKVKEIKHLLSEKVLTQKEIAKIYEVNVATISRINKNLCWKNI